MTKLQIIAFLCFLSGYSQQIKHSLYFKNECTNKIEICKNYHLEKDGITYSAFESPEIILPKKGTYKLFSDEIGEDFEIHIDKLINSDTLNKSSIEIFIKQINPSFKKNISAEELRKIRLAATPKYFVCGKECNGYQSDNYANGKTRFSGTFENGYPIGELKEFYQNGNIRQISRYGKDAILEKIIRYNVEGEIIK